VRVLLAGDWHGNRDWAATCFGLAASHGCAAVLQLGDFGLWPGREAAWLDHVDGLAAAAGSEVVWIDGNHEDHDSLDRWRGAADDAGMVRMRDHVRWATRGTRWEWAGVRFGALGGAVSVDRFLRRKGVNWWPQEAITRADVDRLGDAPLDVLVAHAGPTTGAFPSRPLRLPQAILDDARANRDLLDEAVARTSPRLVAHGHYHVRYRAEVDGRAVEGLAHDKSTAAEALAVLDLDAGLDVAAV
jgi:hypothetical protein